MAKHPVQITRRHPFPAVIALILSVGVGTGASAETVYKYIGPNGATIYSDSPPSHTDDYEEITFKEYPARNPEEHRETIEQMSATAERLKADRLEREASLQPKPGPATPPAVVYYPQPESYRDTYLYPRYPYYRRHDHHRDPRPPYRIDRDRNSREDRLDRMRTPITIPSLGETTRERANQ